MAKTIIVPNLIELHEDVDGRIYILNSLRTIEYTYNNFCMDKTFLYIFLIIFFVYAT